MPDTENRGTAPWSKRADELFDVEGPYADFAAFEEWFKARGLDELLEVEMTLDILPIYHSFSTAFCGDENVIPDRSEVDAEAIF